MTDAERLLLMYAYHTARAGLSYAQNNALIEIEFILDKVLNEDRIPMGRDENIRTRISERIHKPLIALMEERQK